MADRSGIITMKGDGLTLTGNEVKTGDKAHDFVLTKNDLSPAALSDYKGKVIIFSVVPSLDTGVCDLQTRKFNEEASKLADDIVILTVSMDLPFAQSRWCGAAGVERLETLSDYKEASFGNAYGVLIKELRLLTRSVFVVDKDGVIRYIEIVPEITDEPNYDAAVEAAKKLL